MSTASLVIYQGAHRPAICMWRSEFRTYIVFITKLRRQPAEVIQNHEHINVRNIDQSKAQHRKYKRLKLGGGQPYNHCNVQAVTISVGSL